MVNNSAKNLSLTFLEEPWKYNEPQCLLLFIQHQLSESQEVIVVMSNCSNMHGQVSESLSGCMPSWLSEITERLLLASEAELQPPNDDFNLHLEHP
jgi:hypothetical protein